MTTLKDDRRPDWLASRRHVLGGSDAAAILGMNPFRSAFTVFLSKTDVFDDDTPSEPAEWGLRLEAVVAEAWEDKTGLKVAAAPDLLRHPDHQWMGASLDRWVIDDHGTPIAVYEGKTASPFDAAWDNVDQGVIPDYVHIQCQHYLAVTGMGVCHGAVLIGGSRHRVWKVVRDDNLIADLITAEKAWWERHIVGNTPPPIDAHPATEDALRAMFPEGEQTVVDLPAEADAIIGRWLDAKAAVKAAKRAEDVEANMLRLLLGPHETGLLDGEPAVTNRTSHPRRIDTKALRSAHPEIVAEFETTEPVRRLMPAGIYSRKETP